MSEINTSEGYICLFRKFTNWEWYDDANTMRVFLHCLLSANHKDNKWRGILIQKGSFITSVSKLAYSLKLTPQQIRTSINKLKSTNEITSETTSSFTLITVNKWNLYQQNNKQDNKPITNEQQTDNKRVTTNNNDNNDNNEKNENNSLVEKPKKVLDPFFSEEVTEFFALVKEYANNQYNDFKPNRLLVAQMLPKISLDMEIWKQVLKRSRSMGHKINGEFKPLSLKNMFEHYSEILDGTYGLVNKWE